LTVSNGAVVFAGNLGVIGTQNAASLNTVTVTDPGSMWVNEGELDVGRSGPLNRLNVNNGGTVTASNLFVGLVSTSTDNRVVVDAGTLRVTNAMGTGVLDVRRGTVSLRAGLVDVDRLVMTNVAGGFDLAGGSLVTRGAAISNIGGFTVSGSTTNPAIRDVRAGTGIHALGVTLSVGSSLSFNQMLITNGGTLTTDVAYIGSNPGSSSDLAQVSGVGSKWTAATIDVNKILLKLKK
jgi:T5SS/PEP-CTERM-associated repeat protein